uniref:SRCR domain-containing protein n=1 Tax=Oryzias latipes TaxID=8090 RepID=A0A3P9H5Q1_ORYLA
TFFYYRCSSSVTHNMNAHTASPPPPILSRCTRSSPLSYTNAAPTRQIRLVGSGSTPCSGRVEVYYGFWGTVCDDDWDLNDAIVICRQLSCGPALQTPGSAHFGLGSDPIWLDNVACSGNESSLIQCGHRGFGKHSCHHGEDAAVICSGEETSYIIVSLMKILYCSRHAAQSLENIYFCDIVEVYYNGFWGTVCDDEWDLNDSNVVCRQLSCGTALQAPGSAHFGQGSDPIWLDNVACSGSESSLTECGHRGYEKHNCGHDEDAGTCFVDQLCLPESLLLILLISGGIFLLLLFILFLVCLVRRRRKLRNSAVLYQTQSLSSSRYNIFKVKLKESLNSVFNVFQGLHKNALKTVRKIMKILMENTFHQDSQMNQKTKTVMIM